MARSDGEVAGTTASQGVGWVSALIDESQLAAWATLGRLYAAMWRELVEGGVPAEVAVLIMEAQIGAVIGLGRASAGQ